MMFWNKKHTKALADVTYWKKRAEQAERSLAEKNANFEASLVYAFVERFDKLSIKPNDIVVYRQPEDASGIRGLNYVPPALKERGYNFNALLEIPHGASLETLDVGTAFQLIRNVLGMGIMLAPESKLK